MPGVPIVVAEPDAALAHLLSGDLRPLLLAAAPGGEVVGVAGVGHPDGSLFRCVGRLQAQRQLW